MSDKDQDDHLTQLIEMLVYAPVGLLYEYQDVLPQLIKRGKSQVQLARLMAAMAARQRGQGNPTGSGSDPSDAMDPEAVVSALLSALGEMAGDLMGSLSDPSSNDEQGDDRPSAVEVVVEGIEADAVDAVVIDAAVIDPTVGDPMPIANYDELTAREIVGLLGDLDSEQLAKIRTYESDHRARKTILNKIERLKS